MHGPQILSRIPRKGKSRIFMSEGAHVADRALQKFDQMVQEFFPEREDQQMKLQELHADRVDSRSIERIVDTSITSRLWKITSNMEAMVSTCQFMSVALNRTFTVLNSKIEDSVQSHEKLSARIDAALQHQQTQMLELIDGVNDCNAEQVKQK
jgi:hypothetical protein